MSKWLAVGRFKMGRIFLPRRKLSNDREDQDPMRQKGIAEFIVPAVAAMAALLLTTALLYLVNSYLGGHHLMLGYLLPTIFIAIYFGSIIAVLSAFASGVAAAYFLLPPRFSFYIADPLHIAELGFTLLLAVIAARAVAVLTDDVGSSRKSSLRNLR
jgi:K+-sensing histidine kinase KdpD